MAKRKYIRKKTEYTDPWRRLLTAAIVRQSKDLTSPAPGIRQQALEFFDDEGVALAVLLGLPERRVRQKLAEVRGDR